MDELSYYCSVFLKNSSSFQFDKKTTWTFCEAIFTFGVENQAARWMHVVKKGKITAQKGSNLAVTLFCRVLRTMVDPSPIWAAVMCWSGKDRFVLCPPTHDTHTTHTLSMNRTWVIDLYILRKQHRMRHCIWFLKGHPLHLRQSALTSPILLQEAKWDLIHVKLPTILKDRLGCQLPGEHLEISHPRLQRWVPLKKVDILEGPNLPSPDTTSPPNLQGGDGNPKYTKERCWHVNYMTM